MNSPIGDRTKVSGPVLEYGADVAPMARLVLGGRFGEEDCSLSHQRLDRFVEAGGQLV